MDVDLLTAKAKWAVLEKIAKSEVSPLEVAKELNTSAANISTQLRYLELADIVKKRRVSNAQAGKPRMLYSLKKNVMLIMAASNNLHMRQLVEMDSQKETILRIWQLPKSVQNPITRLFYQESQIFTNETSVYYLDHTNSEIQIYIQSQSQKQSHKITIDDKNKPITVTVSYGTTNPENKKAQLIHLGTHA
jgi:predicted transcriptional regulator